MPSKRTDAGPGPLAALLGIERGSIENGRCCLELTVRADHMNPDGVVHGGVVYSLVDSAMGGALTSRLETSERCATLEIKINYLAACSGGKLRAEAWVVNHTKRIGVLEARVHGDGDQLVALATGSFYIQSATV
ncbi:MAG: PaaI family thioesterase [Candidatus Methylomirabilia bacterium]